MSYFEQHSRFLAYSAISDIYALAAGVRSIASANLTAFLDPNRAAAPVDALAIPYRSLDGSPVTFGGKPYERFLTIKGSDSAAFIDRPTYGVGAYIPTGTEALLDTAPFLIITAGETRALTALSSGIATIAIGTSDTWRSAVGSDLVHDSILTIAKRVGRVVVLADSDCFNDSDVSFPFQALATALRSQANVVVAFATVPDYSAKSKARPKKGELEMDALPPLKIGLDKWITKNPGDTSHVIAYLQKRLATETERENAKKDGGYIALGYSAAGSHLWSIPRSMVYNMSANEMTSNAKLTEVCGDAWLRSSYGVEDKRGILQFDGGVVGGLLLDECSRKGNFKEESIRGAGVWLAEDSNEVLVVNNGNDIWRTDMREQERMTSEALYSADGSVGLKRDQPMISKAEVKEILDALKTWSFKRKSDPFMLLGWIGSAMLAGAWKWRPHAALTSEAGCGKSTLRIFIASLLGNAAIDIDGDTTEPGMRQMLGSKALAVMVDESESETSRIAQLMNYFRSASTGAQKVMGTQGHKSITFTLRCSALISAVNLPKMSDTDAGRYIVFNLISEPVNKGSEPDIVNTDNKRAALAGKRLFSKVVHSWPRIIQAQRLLKKLLSKGATLRQADTLSPVLACGWCVLNEGGMTEADAIELIASIDLSDTAAHVEEQKSATTILDHALDTLISIEIDGKMRKTTIRMALEHYADGGDRKIALTLQAYGLKLIVDDVDGHRLLVNERCTEFKKLYRDSQWTNIDFDTALKRIPGASQKRHHKTVYIGGAALKPLSLPISFECCETVNSDGLKGTSKPSREIAQV